LISIPGTDNQYNTRNAYHAEVKWRITDGFHDVRERMRGGQ